MILYKDSVEYYQFLAYRSDINNSGQNSLEYILKAYTLDTNNIGILPYVGQIYLGERKYGEALTYYQKYIDRMRQSGIIDIDEAHRIGYAYLKNGYTDEADYFFDMQLEYCEKSIELDRVYAQNKYAYYDLAMIYAIRGEEERDSIKGRSCQFGHYGKVIWIGILKVLRINPNSSRLSAM